MRRRESSRFSAPRRHCRSLRGAAARPDSAHCRAGRVPRGRLRGPCFDRAFGSASCCTRSGLLLALSWPNLPCALKAAIGIGKRTLGRPAQALQSGAATGASRPRPYRASKNLPDDCHRPGTGATLPSAPKAKNPRTATEMGRPALTRRSPLGAFCAPGSNLRAAWPIPPIWTHRSGLQSDS